MDTSTDQYFQDYFEMFASDGWKQMMADVQSTLGEDALVGHVLAAKTERDLGELQGTVKKAVNLLTLETQLTAAYQAALADEEDEE